MESSVYIFNSWFLFLVSFSFMHQNQNLNCLLLSTVIWFYTFQFEIILESDFVWFVCIFFVFWCFLSILELKSQHTWKCNRVGLLCQHLSTGDVKMHVALFQAYLIVKLKTYCENSYEHKNIYYFQNLILPYQQLYSKNLIMFSFRKYSYLHVIFA